MDTIKTISNEPFRHLVATIGELPTSFTESMSYYELLAWLCNYIEKTLIPAVNENAEAVKELQELYIQLKSYVDNYFDNLDVQEEINNKLDEMSESGELAEIVENYLAQTLPISDNFIINSEKVVDNINDIEYVITRITPNTSKIEYVPMKGAFAGGTLANTYNNDVTAYIYDMAREKNAVVMSTASPVYHNRIIIRDGRAVCTTYTSDGWCVGITNEGELKCYNKDVPLETLLNEWHIVNSWAGGVIMREGESKPDEWHAIEENYAYKHPRTILIQEFGSKDIIFLHIAGRKTGFEGLTYNETIQLIQTIIPNVNIAYALNVGGDVQLSIKGLMQNDCSDPQLRKYWDFIYLDANIAADTYGNIEREIADGRSTDYTLAGLMEKFLPKNYTYLASQKILQAEYSGTTNRFVCNEDYNISLNDGDCILVQFGDMSEEAIDPTARMYLNIHYTDNAAGQLVNFSNGTRAFPTQLKNKVVMMKWVAENYPVLGHYEIVDNGMTTYIETSTDLNSFFDEGVYYSNNFTNKPSYENGWIINIIEPYVETRKYQIFLARPSGNVYVRTVESGTAGDWRTVSFDDSIIPNIPETYSQQDLNSLQDGKIHVAYGYQPTNRPSGADSGWVISIPRSDQNQTTYGVQIYLERGTSTHGKAFIRHQENGNWDTWQQFGFAA